MTEDEGRKLAKNYELEYFEVSALSDIKVRTLFEQAADRMVEFLTKSEGEQMDAKALDKIGIKKFSDLSNLDTSISV